MAGTPIIVRPNDTLKSLSKISGKNTTWISDKIVDFFTEQSKYFCKANCGMKVKEVRETDTEFDAVHMACLIFELTNQEMIDLMDQLEFMDAANDCPRCGCQLNHSEQYGYCTNCGYDEEPDPDSQFGGPDYE